MKDPKIPMMAKVKDKVTGLTGTVTAYLLYMNGCQQYEVKVLCKDKDEIRSFWMDEDRLEVLVEEEKPAKPPKQTSNGGPSRGPSSY